MKFEKIHFEQSRNAIKAFWGVKDRAVQAQIERGINDVGSRSAVTAGKHLDAFVPLIKSVAEACGFDDLEFHMGRSQGCLPGYYRPAKDWDLVVIHKGTLLAAFEFKSIASSFGNNMNNRSEEAVGSAQDFQAALRNNLLGNGNRAPFLGWLMIMRECKESTRAVRVNSKHYSPSPEFKGASYAKRCDILCRRLVEDGLYTATALMLTPDEGGAQNGDFSHISEDHSFANFIISFANHLQEHFSEEANS